MRRLAKLLPIFALAAAAACGGPSSSFPTGGAARGDLCEADTRWFTPIMGEEPRKAILFSLDVMRRNRVWGAALAKAEPGGHFVTSEFAEVLPSFEEIYVFAGPPPGASGEVVIVRKASGREPCTLQGSFSGTPPRCRYGAPATLPSGVREYPAGPGSLFAFADGTWVRVQDWMAPRFRAAFSSTSAAPPLPAVNPAVAMEGCSIRPTMAELGDAGSLGDWVQTNLGAERATIDYLAADAEPGDADLAFSFSSPAQAARAEGETRARCAQGQCPNLFNSVVVGSVARYRVRISSPFR